MSEPTQAGARPVARLLIELGPLVAFVVAIAKAGIVTATVVFMVAMPLALLASWITERRLPAAAIVTTALVLVFGGLTVYLDDPFFIKFKTTIIYSLFAAVLGVGVLLGRPFLKVVLGAGLELTDEGWRLLSVRFSVLFAFFALANEVIRRNSSDLFWGRSKLGFVLVMFVFMLFQSRLIARHRADSSEDPA